MSNIPKNRKHLLELITKNFEKLILLIQDLEDNQGKVKVDDNFTIKDIITIRIWWLEAVQKWVKQGLIGKSFALPAAGYTWKETPALNLETVNKNRTKKLNEARKDLKRSHTKLLKLINSLTDKDLTKTEQFEWAGKWPIMRWISIGSSSQYDGAAKLIRKALKREGFQL